MDAGKSFFGDYGLLQFLCHGLTSNEIPEINNLVVRLPIHPRNHFADNGVAMGELRAAHNGQLQRVPLLLLIIRAAVHLYVSSTADFSDCLALEIARAEGHLPFASFDKGTMKLRDAVAP